MKMLITKKSAFLDIFMKNYYFFPKSRKWTKCLPVK